MKTIRQLTLTVITALFVVTVALLWASASPKVSGKSPPPVALRATGPDRPRTVRGRIARLGRFVSSALARIRYWDFW